MKKIAQFKAWIVEQVLWAEQTLVGLSGKEKRDAVVQRLDDMIKLPAYLEPFDGPIIGFFVDMAVSKLNTAIGHEFGTERLTKAQEEAIADGIEIPTAMAEELKDAQFTEAK